MDWGNKCCCRALLYNPHHWCHACSGVKTQINVSVCPLCITERRNISTSIRNPPISSVTLLCTEFYEYSTFSAVISKILLILERIKKTHGAKHWPILVTLRCRVQRKVYLGPHPSCDYRPRLQHAPVEPNNSLHSASVLLCPLSLTSCHNIHNRCLMFRSYVLVCGVLYVFMCTRKVRDIVYCVVSVFHCPLWGVTSKDYVPIVLLRCGVDVDFFMTNCVAKVTT